MIEDIVTSVSEELTLAYIQAGKHIDSANVLIVAKSLCENIPFADSTEVHEAFRRSKEVQDIPTQRTLSEALRNHRAEAPAPSTAPAIEYRNPLEPWLPSDLMRKRINLITAMKNYCAAVSDELYQEYCRVHVTKKADGGHIRFVNPEKVEAFDAPIKDTLRALYKKYWRKCVCSAGYPENELLNLGLSAPTIPEFRAMLYHEQHG